MFKKTAYMRTW